MTLTPGRRSLYSRRGCRCSRWGWGSWTRRCRSSSGLSGNWGRSTAAVRHRSARTISGLNYEHITMEQHALTIVNDCWNTNISFYLALSLSLSLPPSFFLSFSLSDQWRGCAHPCKHKTRPHSKQRGCVDPCKDKACPHSKRSSFSQSVCVIIILISYSVFHRPKQVSLQLCSWRRECFRRFSPSCGWRSSSSWRCTAPSVPDKTRCRHRQGCRSCCSCSTPYHSRRLWYPVASLRNLFFLWLWHSDEIRWSGCPWLVFFSSNYFKKKPIRRLVILLNFRKNFPFPVFINKSSRYINFLSHPFETSPFY